MNASTPDTSSRANSADPAVLADVRVAVIGAGNMGGPVVRCFLAAGVPAAQIAVVNSSPASSERAAGELGVTAAASRADALAGADVVVLGVKPYMVVGLLEEIRDDVPAGALVVSLAAGVTLAEIEGGLTGGQGAVRAMPNTPVSVGEGCVGLMRGERTGDAAYALAHALFSRAGLAVDITEDQVHALIATSGSLSAFVFTIIEAMTDEGVRQGLKRDLVSQLVQQTVRGAATMLMESGQEPALARHGVSSPGGTTVEGLAELERRGIRPGIASAMEATAERSRALTSS